MEKIPATRLAAAIIGGYAGLLGAAHGFFEIRQGSLPTSGIAIQAIGSGCQPETVWHACFPAMTLVPNFLISGLLALIGGLLLALWAAACAGRPRGGAIQIGLASLLLLILASLAAGPLVGGEAA